MFNLKVKSMETKELLTQEGFSLFRGKSGLIHVLETLYLTLFRQDVGCFENKTLSMAIGVEPYLCSISISNVSRGASSYDSFECRNGGSSS